MCGIGAIFRPEGPPVPLADIRRLVSVLAPRGPDDAAHARLSGARLALGHARLRVVDLEGGAQPIYNEDDSVCVILNGEIYDHAALRGALTARGHRFRTRCDAEVLVHLYEESGPAFVDRLEGEFAFILWDDRRQILLAARDPFGVKPLFWTRTRLPDGREEILLASEVKGLFAPGRAPRAIAPEYLAGPMLGAFPPTISAFAGVRALGPASTLVLTRAGAATERRYWDPVFAPDRRLGLGEAAEELGPALDRAVARRLGADVAVGCFVSGGLDSAVIAALSARRAPGIEGFSLAFPGSALDESRDAALVAARAGIPLHVEPCSPDDLAEDLPAVVEATEASLVNPHAVARRRLCLRARRAGVKAVLTGEGADELFAGYAWFRQEALLRALDRDDASDETRALWAEMVSRGDAADGLLWDSRPARAGADDVLGWPCFAHRRARESDAVVALVIRAGHALAPAARPSGQLLAHHDLAALRAAHPVNASRLLAFDQLAGYVLPNLGDRVEMSVGIEGRQPFLDRGVVDLALRVPPDVLVDPRAPQSKGLVRAAFADLLPPAIRVQRKRPFLAASWRVVLGTPAGRRLVEEHLSREAIDAAGLFEGRALESLSARWRDLPAASPLAARLDRLIGGVLCCQILHRRMVRAHPAGDPDFATKDRAPPRRSDAARQPLAKE